MKKQHIYGSCPNYADVNYVGDYEMVQGRVNEYLVRLQRKHPQPYMPSSSLIMVMILAVTVR